MSTKAAPLSIRSLVASEETCCCFTTFSKTTLKQKLESFWPKIRPRIPSKLRLFDSNYSESRVEFLVPPVTQLFLSKWLHSFFQCIIGDNEMNSIIYKYFSSFGPPTDMEVWFKQKRSWAICYIIYVELNVTATDRISQI